MLKRFLYALVLFSFLFISFTYSQSITGAAKKSGGVGLAIQGVKTGKEGLRQLTKYGQELVTQQNNQTKQTSEQQDIQTNEISQQSIKQNTQNQNIQTKQQTQQNSNNNILDNLASSMQDSTDKLKTGIDKSTKPLQNTISDIGSLFSKIQDSVSSDDNSKEQSIEQTETVSNNDNNNNRDNNGSNKQDNEDAEKTKKAIEAATLKEFKSLVNQLSRPNSELTMQELKQFEKLVEKFGGKLRYDLNPTKGKILKPHVQVEGLGKSVGSRHVWIAKEAL